MREFIENLYRTIIKLGLKNNLEEDSFLLEFYSQSSGCIFYFEDYASFHINFFHFDEDKNEASYNLYLNTLDRGQLNFSTYEVAPKLSPKSADVIVKLFIDHISQTRHLSVAQWFDKYEPE